MKRSDLFDHLCPRLETVTIFAVFLYVLFDFKGLSRIIDRHLDESLSFPKHKVGKTQGSRKRKDNVHSSCGSGLEKWCTLDIIRIWTFPVHWVFLEWIFFSLLLVSTHTSNLCASQESFMIGLSYSNSMIHFHKILLSMPFFFKARQLTVQMMQNPQILAALQERLDGLVETPTGYIERYKFFFFIVLIYLSIINVASVYF